jgi:hypothetical protein
LESILIFSEIFGTLFNFSENSNNNKLDEEVVVENDLYDNYYTEKITDCFATGTIPVYMGSPTIGDVFNMDGIIQLDSKFDITMLTEDLYNSKLDAVHDNLNRVINLEMSDDTLWNGIHETRNN